MEDNKIKIFLLYLYEGKKFAEDYNFMSFLLIQMKHEHIK